MIVIGGPGSRWRARMLRMTSAEWTPWLQRFGAGGLDRRQPVGQHRGQDVDHLPIAVVGAGELAADPSSRGRQHPVLERRAIAQGAGLAGQHRHVVPGIVDRLVAPEGARMLADDPAVLAHHDAIGIGADLDRPADRAALPPSTCCCRSAPGRSWRPTPAPHGSRRTGRHRERGFGRSASNTSQIVCSRELGMPVRLGVGDALVEQPGVQLVVALHPQPRREEPLADQPDLVLDLPLLPARRRRAGDRLDQVMAAHLQEAAIVGRSLPTKIVSTAVFMLS